MSTTLPARVIALTAALAAAAVWLAAPVPLVCLLASPAFLGGSAFGLLARGAPDLPSNAEAGLWAWLLSPPLLTLVYAAGRVLAGLDPPAAASHPCSVPDR